MTTNSNPISRNTSITIGMLILILGIAVTGATEFTTLKSENRELKAQVEKIPKIEDRVRLIEKENTMLSTELKLHTGNENYHGFLGTRLDKELKDIKNGRLESLEEQVSYLKDEIRRLEK